MSFDIYAIVPADRWPTFAELNAAMSERGYPASLEGFDSASDRLKRVPSVDAQFGLTPEKIAELGALNIGALVRLSGALVEPDFGYDPIDDGAVVRFHDALSEINVPVDILRKGDILAVHSGHSVAETWNAGVYILCSLILDFGAYGFEFQGGAHGREGFAKELFDSLDLSETNAPNK